MASSGGSNRRDKLILLAFLIVGLAGLAAYILLYDSAFPSASLNLRITRNEAGAIGEKFFRERGFDLAGYERVVTFGYSNSAKEYLERNLGLQEANRLMGEKVNTWYWEVRWFKPLQEEEFSADISATGEVVGFWRHLPENHPGENLTRTEARKLADEFLIQVGLDPAKYRLVEDSSRKRPNRTDHYFEWEELGLKALDATNRMYVSVAGNSVSNYSNYLKIPEKWNRKVSEESGQGEFYLTVADVFHVALSIAALIVLVFALRARAVRWQFAVILGSILGLVELVMWLNSFPIMKAGYTTTESWGSYLGNQVTGIVITVLATAGSVIALASSGDVMQRWALSAKTALSGLLTRRGLRSAEFVRANVVGFGLGLATLGYVSVFYVIAMKYFGVWSPASVPYDDTLSTALPWIYPLTIGLSASLTEELLFRFFAISFLKKYLKLTWAAVLIPAVVWAFLHSNYPQQPSYIRGIELTIEGIVLGMVFLKYGVVATIVSHYTYNAVVSGTLLLQSENLYFRISGFAVMALMLLPLLPAVLRFFRKPSEEPPEERENVELVQPDMPWSAIPPPPPETEPVRVWTPFSPTRMKTIVLAGIVSLAVALAFFSDEVFDTSEKVMINRKDAQRIAEEQIRKLGVDTRQYMSYTAFYSGYAGLEGDYIAREVGRRKGDELLKKELHDPGWCTNWFKPRQKESFEITLDPDGTFYTWDHSLEEDDPGAKLTQQDALASAEKWLASQGIDFSACKLVDSSTNKEKNRNDHRFTWEKNSPKIKEAAFRFSVDVQGDEIISRSDFVKIPREYYRKMYEQTTRMTVCAGIMGIGGFLLSLGVVCVFIVLFAGRQIDWRLAFKIGAVATLFSALSSINRLPGFYSGYSDTEPLSRYIAASVIYGLMGLVMAFIGNSVLAGFADAVYRRAFPTRPSLGEWLAKEGNRWRQTAFKQGTIAAYSALIISGALFLAQSRLDEALFPKLVTASGYGYSGLVNGLSPILGSLADTGALCVTVPLSLMLVASLVKLYIKRSWLLITLVISFTLLGVGSEARNWHEVWQQLLFIGVSITVAYPLLVRVLRHNLFSYVVICAAGSLLAAGSPLIQFTDLSLRLNGLAVTVLGLLPIVIALLLHYRRGPEPEDSVEEHIEEVPTEIAAGQ